MGSHLSGTSSVKAENASKAILYFSPQGENMSSWKDSQLSREFFQLPTEKVGGGNVTKVTFPPFPCSSHGSERLRFCGNFPHQAALAVDIELCSPADD